jgi:hypothetical protein
MICAKPKENHHENHHKSSNIAIVIALGVAASAHAQLLGGRRPAGVGGMIGGAGNDGRQYRRAWAAST